MENIQRSINCLPTNNCCSDTILSKALFSSHSPLTSSSPPHSLIQSHEIIAMPEAAILSPNLSPALRPPNLNRKKQKPKAPILREYNRPPFKPRLLNVRRDISASVPDSSASLQYYASLASSLAQCGRLADFLMIAESVLSGGAHPKFIANINVRMVSEGIAYVLKNSGLKGVLDFISEVERIGITAYQLFDEKSRGLLRVECTRLSVEGRLEELVSVMETLLGYQFPIQGIIDPTDVLTKFVERQDLDLAKRFVSLYPQSQLLFSSLIEEFGKKNDLRSAMKVFESLKEQPGGINKFACRSIIDVCGLCGDFMQSRAIFEALGVEADIASYNILLKACCNVRRVDLALKIYEELKAVGGRGSLELDAYTYTSMIKVLSAEGMWETVLTIKEDMSSAGVRPNLITWSLILSTCANCGLADHALKLFDEMLRDNCLPNTHCCNTILHACVKSFQFDRAFRLYHFWRDCGIRNPPEMESEADSIMNPFASPFKPTVFTYNILMKACGTDYHRARALVREMTGLGIPPDIITWSTLIDICGKARYVKGALLALKDMKGSGIKLDVQAYTVAIKACVENKKLKIAFFLFDEMKRYQVQPNRATYNTLLRARTNYGSLYEVQQSLAIYQEMRKAGFSANDYYLKGLIEEWCEEVLCSRNKDDSSAHISKKTTEQQKPYHLFFEKVATHLQNDKERDRVIDVRGLSKVEARILVLSVLRMMKENYLMGEVTKENMVIFTGADAVSIPAVSNSLEVQHAIMHVLKHELGLTVITGYGSKPDIVPRGSLLSPVSKAEGSYKYSARRPQNLGVVTVPVESLHQWLHKRNHK